MYTKTTHDTATHSILTTTPITPRTCLELWQVFFFFFFIYTLLMFFINIDYVYAILAPSSPKRRRRRLLVSTSKYFFSFSYFFLTTKFNSKEQLPPTPQTHGTTQIATSITSTHPTTQNGDPVKGSRCINLGQLSKSFFSCDFFTNSIVDFRYLQCATSHLLAR